MHGAAGHHYFLSVNGGRRRSNHVILYMLIKVLRATRQHYIGRCIVVDERRHAVHVAHCRRPDDQGRKIINLHILNKRFFFNSYTWNGNGHHAPQNLKCASAHTQGKRSLKG